MVEATLITGTSQKELFWIYDHDDLYWAPGEFHSEKKSSVIVKCIKTGDGYEIDNKDRVVVHPSCLGKLQSYASVYLLVIRGPSRLAHVGRLQRRTAAPHSA
jgi:hypothetical protein